MKKVVFLLVMFFASNVAINAQNSNAFNFGYSLGKAIGGSLFGSRSSNQNTAQSKDMQNYLNYFSMGERYQKHGLYYEACKQYAMANSIMQRTTDINLRQIGVSSYTETLSNNLMFCINQYKAENPNKYLEITTDGSVNIKTLEPMKPNTVNYNSSSVGSQPVTPDINTKISTTKTKHLCHLCNGRKVCNICKGTGQKKNQSYATRDRYTACHTCNGTGICIDCNGVGYHLY